MQNDESVVNLFVALNGLSLYCLIDFDVTAEGVQLFIKSGWDCDLACITGRLKVNILIRY